MNATTGLLEEAITYAARSVLDVTPAFLPRPTPCRGWNLDMLLRHASESLAALHEGTVARHIALIPAAPGRAAADPAQTFRDRAGRLLAVQAAADSRCQVVGIGDLPLPAFAMECAGAIEIAVHGWDISQACGRHRPIPDALAASLLAVVALLVPETGRHPLFGPPLTPAAHASPGDRLVAYLGREPSPSRLAPDHSLSTGFQPPTCERRSGACRGLLRALGRGIVPALERELRRLRDAAVVDRRRRPVRPFASFPRDDHLLTAR